MRIQKITVSFLVTITMAGAFSSEVFAKSYRTSPSDVKVHGYYRSNGTYIKPYYRTRSDGYRWNNYGCRDYGRCR